MITSLQNPTIKNLMKLHQKKTRDKEGVFLVEGEHLVAEAIMSNRLKMLIISEDYEGEIEFEKSLVVSSRVAKKLSNTTSSSDIFGECFIESRFEFSGQRYLLCDGIQDPGNLGTMIRSAHSFGFDGLIVSRNSADIYNDKCVRSSQGALFHIAHQRMDLTSAIQKFKEHGLTIIGTDVKRARSLEDVTSEKLVLIVGNEGQGVSDSLLKMSDFNVKIETSSFESLNVAVAAGILMYHFRKQ